MKYFKKQEYIDLYWRWYKQKKSIEELKGTQECKIKHFAFCYNNSCPIHKEAKYGASYWPQKPSLEQFKSTSKSDEGLYNMGINPEDISTVSDTKAT